MAEQSAPVGSSVNERVLGRWGMSPWRMLGLSAVGVSFVAASVHQVVEHRDDWPLSSYQMYPHVEGKKTQRNRLVGVSPEGEFPITGAHIGALRTRIQYLIRNHRNQPKHLRRVLNALQREYENRRQQGLHAGPVLQGLRMYSETWKVQKELVGIDEPRRTLRQGLYIAPLSLLNRWTIESKDPGAPELPPVSVPADDVVLYAKDGELRGTARFTSGEAPSEHAAVLLDAGKASYEASLPKSSVSFEFQTSAGKFTLWARVKASGGEKADSYWLTLDGKQLLPRQKQGFGNFREVVPAGAYVWVGRALEHPALGVGLAAGAHELALSVREGPLTVDQIWLSRSQQETPDFNARVSAP